MMRVIYRHTSRVNRSNFHDGMSEALSEIENRAREEGGRSVLWETVNISMGDVVATYQGGAPVGFELIIEVEAG